MFFSLFKTFFGEDRRRSESKTKQLLTAFCLRAQISLEDFVGVTFSDLLDLEDLFKINIVVYQLLEEEGFTKMVHNYSRRLYDLLRVGSMFRF